MIYVVLGMHKSGTTLLANILHHSGVNMLENLEARISYDKGNYYEREATQAFNREILKAKPFIDGYLPLDLPAPDEIEMSEDLRLRMRKFIQNCNEIYQNWGFKDPRTCLTYPAWASVLPEHKIISIYRSPNEIWPHFRRTRRFYSIPTRAWKYINRWFEHNKMILDYLQNTETDFLVLSHRELMKTQAEFDRLQDFVGIKLEDRRVDSLWRNRSKEYPLLKMALWLTSKKTGSSLQEVSRQFEALRNNL